ncbi:alpha/beta hydrolase [Candidatus Woesearchaeota archaeon]|nr:alpha/beta hydrolase [Candidatus Woesearchaeota archaeon]
MERVIFKNSRGLNLVGNLYSASSKTIIIMSHGFTGDKSEWGSFDKIAEALHKENYNVLAFDFSGSGESDDDSLTVDKEVDDLKSAIKYVKSRGFTKIGLFGHSLGGLVSLKNYNNDITTMVLTAPVTNKKENYGNKKFNSEQLKELEEKGYITKIRDKGIRRKIIIDKQMLKDRENVNQEELLKNIKCPVLIIHGDQDKSVPLEDSKNAMQYLSNESKLEIIPRATHGYDFIDKFIEYTISWFTKYLPK